MPKIVDKTQMRKAIVSAALRAFASKGFQHTSMSDIAKEAEIAKGTLYLYFRSKEALVEEMIAKHFVALEQKFASPSAVDTLEQFLAQLELVLLPSPEEEALVPVMFEAIGSLFVSEDFSLKYKEFSSALQEWYAKILKALQQKEEISSSIHPHTFSRVLLGMTDGIIMHKCFLEINAAEYKEICTEIVCFVKKGLEKRDD